MFIFPCQNVGQYQNIRTANNLFKNLLNFKYMDIILMRKLRACWILEFLATIQLENLWLAGQAVIFFLVYMALKCGLPHQLSVFGILRRICGPKRKEVTGGWRKLIMRSFTNCRSCQLLLQCSNGGELSQHGMWYMCNRRETHLL
jgi:hypothetical protein